MAYTPPERYVTINSISSGKKIPCKTGEKLTITILKKRCIVDSHSHIENGACAPLPLLWDKLPLQLHFNRTKINNLGILFKFQAGVLQIKKTSEIGNQAVKELDNTFGPKSDIGSSDFYKGNYPFPFTVIQMMDMEYAWIGGFKGKTIYQEDETPWYFYERQRASDPNEKCEKIPLPGENEKTFSKWKKQYLETIRALKNNPLRLIGMYHYEPRRWNYDIDTKLDNNFRSGPWDYPFKEIVSATGEGLFIGFKMYPPLGYKPLDPELLYLQKFYGRCEREGIPILVHCSPGGMYTHEIKLYLEYDKELSLIRYPVKELFLESSDTNATAIDKDKMAIDYFWENYVHPREWRKVLKKFPKLKLCLAHFGGDEWNKGLESDWIKEIIELTKEYDNVYTDFSCWDLNDNIKKAFTDLLSKNEFEHLRKKILFGTDWYMTLLSNFFGNSYKKFCEEFWEFFKSIDDGMMLWEQFTFVNPIKFYGIFDKMADGKDKLECMYMALAAKECDKKKLNKNYKFIRETQQYYEKIKDR